MAKRIIKLMLDSGAYSAWTKGEAIDLQLYIEFCERHAEDIWVPVNLDVIPGRMGEVPTMQQVEEAAVMSWQNGRKMRKAGLKPLMVYHQGERRYWLEKMLDSGSEYIGLGAVANKPAAVRIQFLDEVFNYLCGKNYPEVKIHGFGITAVEMIQRYPWYSIDSTTCILMSGMGRIFLPRLTDGEEDYTRPPHAIVMSNMDTGGDRGGDHYLSMGTKMKGRINGFLHKEGFKTEDIISSDLERCRINGRIFERIGKAWTPKPFRIKSSSLFSTPSSRGQAEPINKSLIMVFSTNPGTAQDYSFTKEGCPHRLVSFYPLQKKPNFPLHRYVTTGLISDKEHRRRDGKAIIV